MSLLVLCGVGITSRKDVRQTKPPVAPLSVRLTRMKPLAPAYPASSADGFRAAPDPKFTIAPRFLATMPGSARRVIETVEFTFISTSDFIWGERARGAGGGCNERKRRTTVGSRLVEPLGSTEPRTAD